LKKLLALALLCFSSTAYSVDYKVTVLGTLDGTGNSIATAINDNGVVVGRANNGGTGEAVSWTSGTAASLGFQGIAHGINNSGQIVGETGTGSLYDPGRAFLYSGGVTTDLGDLGGTKAVAYGINDLGVVVGYSMIAGDSVNELKAFRYDGSMTNLGDVNGLGTGYSRAQGINNSGVIAGRGSIDTFANSEKHMIRWDADNTLNQIVGPNDYSTGLAINNNGVIVGNGKNADGKQRAIIWGAGGGLTMLDTLGGNNSRAFGVNDLGQVVGSSAVVGGVKHAFITLDGGATMIDLNTATTGLSGFSVLNEAYDINESGQIIGYGTLSTGEISAFLLTPVPVPAAVWLFGSALGLLGWVRRRRLN